MKIRDSKHQRHSKQESAETTEEDTKALHLLEFWDTVCFNDIIEVINLLNGGIYNQMRRSHFYRKWLRIFQLI